MNNRKNILVVIGSASEKSSNQTVVDYFRRLTQEDFQLAVFTDLKTLPHFDPEQSVDNPPPSIVAFRQAVENADGVIICTPEYVFSIPSGLKNAIEWCVATTVFTDKPLGLITASAHGQKGHEELQRIMRTLVARFTEETTLLIQGVKGKVSSAGELTDTNTKEALERFARAFKTLVNGVNS